jgi:bifunctional non-homologous end joining protein LigD
MPAAPGITFCAFDLLFLDGKDLRPLLLEQRKARLEKIIANAGPHMAARGDELHRALCNQRFEGIIAMRADKPYRNGRSTDWLIKCTQEHEFVIAGFTRSDTKLAFASLILALHKKGVAASRGRREAARPRPWAPGSPA